MDVHVSLQACLNKAECKLTLYERPDIPLEFIIMTSQQNSWFGHQNNIKKIVAAFEECVMCHLHVSPAKHSYAWLPRKCDYWIDRRWTKCSICAAMLCKRHNKMTSKSPHEEPHVMNLVICQLLTTDRDRHPKFKDRIHFTMQQNIVSDLRRHKMNELKKNYQPLW